MRNQLAEVIEVLTREARDATDEAAILTRTELSELIRRQFGRLARDAQVLLGAALRAGAVTRRDVLGMLGVVGGGGLGLAMGSGLVRASDHATTVTEYANAKDEALDRTPNVITVPGGETQQFVLGAGETLQNVLVDVTASGAGVQFHGGGEGFTIRNVGVRGATRGYGSAPRTVGAGGRISHCYFGDGDSGRGPANPGVYVGSNLSTQLLVRGCNFSNWGDNGIYASPPGNPAEGEFAKVGDVGQGGAVKVEDFYGEGNGVAHVRLGTAGSYARNCVANGGPHRGFWAVWERVVFENCDATTRVSYDAGGRKWNKMKNTVAELRNCRGTGKLRARGGAKFVGDQHSNPRRTPPQGVPTSAEEAAGIS